MPAKILILGGYGNTGIFIAKSLIQESDAQIIIAGRNLNRAQQFVADLNSEFNTDRATSKQVDAADINSLEAAFADITMVLVASSTMDYVRNVAECALKANIDYFDIQLSSPKKLAVLNSLREQIEKQQRCFITDGGFHPGVPAAMVRYAASEFETLEVANVSACFQLDWGNLLFSKSTTSEFIDELMEFNPQILKNKNWVKMDMRKLPQFEFGDLFGKRYCAAMFLEELRLLPDVIPSLKETGFYIAGFNWMIDYIIMPIAFTAFRIFGKRAKKPIEKLFDWGLSFSKPPFGAVLQLEARGEKDGHNSLMHMRLTHNDAYILTAIPVVACLLQYLGGNIGRPGLWFQANLVDPKEFFSDIERLGIKVCISRG